VGRARGGGIIVEDSHAQMLALINNLTARLDVWYAEAESSAISRALHDQAVDHRLEKIEANQERIISAQRDQNGGMAEQSSAIIAIGGRLDRSTRDLASHRAAHIRDRDHHEAWETAREETFITKTTARRLIQIATGPAARLMIAVAAASIIGGNLGEVIF